jgi:hypothetical protein
MAALATGAYYCASYHSWICGHFALVAEIKGEQAQIRVRGDVFAGFLSGDALRVPCQINLVTGRKHAVS